MRHFAPRYLEDPGGQSNHDTSPHVFWRNLEVKTFPFGIEAS